MFDEPSSYLDVKQRLNAARIIRTLLRPDCYVIVVEHDLSVLDYLVCPRPFLKEKSLKEYPTVGLYLRVQSTALCLELY